MDRGAYTLDFRDQTFLDAVDGKPECLPITEKARELLRCLALCHTIIVSEVTDDDHFYEGEGTKEELKIGAGGGKKGNESSRSGRSDGGSIEYEYNVRLF